MKRRAAALIVHIAMLTVTGCCCDTIHLTKAKRTIADLGTVGHALEQYRNRTGSYPVSREVDLESIARTSGLLPADSTLTTDAWNRELLYMSNGRSYVVWSRGRDGLSDENPPGGPQPDFDADIVLFDGEFWQHTEGMVALRPIPDVSPFRLLRGALDEEIPEGSDGGDRER